MLQHLESKTVIGLTILLAVIVGLTAFGKLTPEAVDALKYIGASFMAVRATANAGEAFQKKSQ